MITDLLTRRQSPALQVSIPPGMITDLYGQIGDVTYSGFNPSRDDHGQRGLWEVADVGYLIQFQSLQG